MAGHFHMIKTALSVFLASAAMLAADLPSGYKLLYEQTFDSPDAIEGFTMSDPNAWTISKEEKGGGALELARQSKYSPPVRSPVNIALISDKVFGDFILEADLVQTGREYGHRDMCLFFGFERPGKFYYAHIASKADPNAHNIFRVNDLPRTNIAQRTTVGANWGLNVWHKVRLERNVGAGTIKVYFDDMKEPIMVTEDRTFADGRIGFGSFDDTGKIDNIRIWGPKVAEVAGRIRFDAKP
jgi:hypothetical protein